jgi:hypothetical protein
MLFRPMDDWHNRLARDIVAETPAGKLDDGDAMLEVAFGAARAAVTYALELARAHRLPAMGSVAGDHLWIRLGDGSVRVTLNRRASLVEADVARSPAEGAAGRVTTVRWKEDERGLYDEKGAATDLGAMARAAIADLVSDWKARRPEQKKLSSAPPPDLDDTPTR